MLCSWSATICDESRRARASMRSCSSDSSLLSLACSAAPSSCAPFAVAGESQQADAGEV